MKKLLLVLLSFNTFAQMVGTPFIVPFTKKTITFGFTGGQQTWTVPAGCTSVTFDIRGAEGGHANGGNGGRVQGTIAVTPGTIYYIYVGGQPTGRTAVYGFAGNGGSGNQTGGINRDGFAGGGLSAMSTSSTIGTTGLVAVAGGGGGASGDRPSTTSFEFLAGGAAGGTSGADGSQGSYNGFNERGRGGTNSAGGIAGASIDPQSSNPTAGGAFTGGRGGSVSANNDWAGGGGGGAGRFGGGGGAGGGDSNGGGGGGSSFIAAGVTNPTNTANFNTGNGSITLTFSSY